MNYRIGNIDPFKLTPASAKKFIEALIETESRLIGLDKDTTCPPIHIIATVQINDKKKKEKFEEILGKPLEDIPQVGFEGLHVW